MCSSVNDMSVERVVANSLQHGSDSLVFTTTAPGSLST